MIPDDKKQREMVRQRGFRAPYFIIKGTIL